MRTPTLHSSILGGAGVLTPAASSLLSILDMVLVDGYSRNSINVPALGWSRPFTRALNVCVYLPATGVMPMIRIGDDQAASQYRVASLTAYESMSTVNTGSGPWGNTPQMYLGKCSGISSAVPEQYSPAWWIVGDDKGFYLIVGDGELYSTDASRGLPVVMHYLGDFESLRAGDVYNTALLAHCSPTLLPSLASASFFKTWFSYGVGASTLGRVYATATGGSLGVNASPVQPAGQPLTTSILAPIDVVGMTTGSPVPRLSQVLLNNDGDASNAPRGILPGLFSIWPNMVARTGDTFTDDGGNTFMVFNLKTAASSWVQYALQLNSW